MAGLRDFMLPLGHVPLSGLGRPYGKLQALMAARSVKIRQTDETRAKIQASQLVNRLQDNALGKLIVEMTPGQVRSAEILLRKSIPDLSSTENKTEVVHRYVARVPDKATDTQAWQTRNEPKTPLHS